MKISSKTHQIAPFKKEFPGKHAPEPPSKRVATPRVASPQKVGRPLANHTHSHGNLFEKMRFYRIQAGRRFIVCSVYALKK